MFENIQRSFPSTFIMSPSRNTSKGAVSNLHRGFPNVRRAGQFYLPATPSESKDLLNLKPSFRTSRPSAFDEKHYKAPCSLSNKTFRLPSFRRPEVGHPPTTYYPVELMEMYPSVTGDHDQLVLAEGRILFLALEFISNTINDAIDQDPASGKLVVPVTDASKLKSSLSAARPALVLLFFFFYVL